MGVGIHTAKTITRAVISTSQTTASGDRDNREGEQKARSLNRWSKRPCEQLYTCKSPLFSKRKFRPYSEFITCHLSGESTPKTSNKRSKNWASCTPRSQLGKNNIRSMGANTGAGSQVRTDLSGGATAVGRDPQAIRKRGYSSCSHTPTAVLHIYILDVSHSKEGWHNEANNRSQGIKQVHSLGGFQDGRNPSDSNVATRGRLDGEIRSEGRILCCSNSPGRQKVPHLSIFRAPFTSSSAFHMASRQPRESFHVKFGSYIIMLSYTFLLILSILFVRHHNLHVHVSGLLGFNEIHTL